MTSGTYVTQLTSRQELARKTMAFSFARPVGFEFQAGQFLTLNLVQAPGGNIEDDSRTFTIASAPSEHNLTVATRLRDSAFKKNLETAPVGSKFAVEGPFGSFTLPAASAGPLILLAGGIGITPFRSMLVEACKAGSSQRIYLFYSNREPTDAAFLQELQKIQGELTTFKLVATMTHLKESSDWPGETGHITREMIGRHVEDWQKGSYLLAGPPSMITTMQAMILQAGIPRENVLVEKFSGY